MLKTLSLNAFADYCEQGNLLNAEYEFDGADQIGEVRAQQHLFHLTFDSIQVSRFNRTVRLLNNMGTALFLCVKEVRLSTPYKDAVGTKIFMRIISEDLMDPADEVEYIVNVTLPHKNL